VAFYHSSLYIVADTCQAQQDEDPIRHLKLDRFRRATACDEWFTPRNDFDLEAYLRQSIGVFGGGKTTTFRIHISAYAAPWVREDPWHPDQQVTQRSDGSIVLTVQAAHELEVIPRVLALGTEAELLAPAASRKALARVVRALCQRYRET
jgi:predicted DNA-binding transcriptional regulator YafY